MKALNTNIVVELLAEKQTYGNVELLNDARIKPSTGVVKSIGENVPKVPFKLKHILTPRKQIIELGEKVYFNRNVGYALDDETLVVNYHNLFGKDE